MFINSYKLDKHELSCAKSCKLCASKKVQKSVPMLWKRPRNQPNMLNFVCPSCPRCGKCRNFQWFYPLQSHCRPCTSCHSVWNWTIRRNALHKPSTHFTLHIKWVKISECLKITNCKCNEVIPSMYMYCTCNVLQYYVCSIYRIRKFGIKVTCSRRLLAKRAKRNSLTLDVKRIESTLTHRNLRKTGKYSKPNRSTLGNK